MIGTLPLLRLRGKEIARTWRWWLFPAVMVFFAATGPIIARYANDLLATVLSQNAGGTIELPDPTAADASAQWAKDLTQLVILVVAIIAAGAINSEVRSGYAALILVKPASRPAYVVTHAIATMSCVMIAAFLGALVSWGMTTVMFGEADLGRIIASTVVWLVLATVLVCASLLASATIDAAAGAAGVGLGVYFLLALLGVVPWLAQYTPAGLIPLVATVATGTQEIDHTLWWPLGTGLVLAAIFLTWAAAAFQRREL